MSNKSRSQRSSGSATPLDDKSSNRRARRKEKQLQQQREEQNAEAGPSGSKGGSSSKDATNSKRDSDDKKGRGESSFAEADFIPFTFDDDEGPEPEAEPAQEDWPPVREWDKGKGKARERERDRDREHAGRKRKVEEVDFDDGYANKKQRVAAASRKAPWARDVDWDSCANVAEMCEELHVHLFARLLTSCYRLHNEVEAFVKYISPTPVEDEVRSLIVALVSQAVTKTYPDAQVLPFGSYETKLYLPLGYAIPNDSHTVNR